MCFYSSEVGFGPCGAVPVADVPSQRAGLSGHVPGCPSCLADPRDGPRAGMGPSPPSPFSS